MENFDVEGFEKEWTELGIEICQAVYINSKTQELKNALLKNGYMTLEEKSTFIDICDKTKYDLIYAKYGAEGTPGYKAFSEKWQEWFQKKGVESTKDRGQRSSVDHILFGSTPDPAPFLTDFEKETLGSLSGRK